MITILLAAAAAAATPSAQAEALGLELARMGMLGGLLPSMAAKETGEMVAAHPELSAAEQAELRRTAAATFAATSAKLFAVIGHSYAQKLTVDELKALVAFNGSPVAVKYRGVQPQVVAETMAAMKGIDFKGDTLRAFCAKTRKACAK